MPLSETFEILESRAPGAVLAVDGASGLQRASPRPQAVRDLVCADGVRHYKALSPVQRALRRVERRIRSIHHPPADRMRAHSGAPVKAILLIVKQFFVVRLQELQAGVAASAMRRPLCNGRPGPASGEALLRLNPAAVDGCEASARNELNFFKKIY